MYDIHDYGVMINDSVRVDAYLRSLESIISPESVVLDIGTGSGIFALIACQLGARRVYAIEPMDVIELAKELAEINNFSEQITFIQDKSVNVDLPEKVDVIVSDLRGQISLYQQHIPAIIDARERFLVPGGHLIPMQDNILASLIESPDFYMELSAPWSKNDFGLNMKSGLNYVMNSVHTSKPDGKKSIGETKHVATFNFNELQSPDLSSELTWQIEQETTLHGIEVWFDTKLTEDVGFSNKIDRHNQAYGKSFFPVSEPVHLETGDTVTVLLRADLVGQDYIWQWSTRVCNKKKSAYMKADFKQSTFNGKPFSLSSLHKRAGNQRAELNDDGFVDLRIMNMMEQGLLLEDIARHVTEHFPDHFLDWQQALAHIGELSLKYSH